MFRYYTIVAVLLIVTIPSVPAQESTTLFDGTNTDQWEFRPGGWVIEDDTLTCRLETVTQKNGQTRTRGMGYIWTKNDYSDFDLSLQYKLSETANSGVFFRSDPDNPVQGGFEIQLLDNHSSQSVKAKKRTDGRTLNGAFYDAKAPLADPANPVGQWNDFRLICKGPSIRVLINDVTVVDANVDDWDTARKNPDGSDNKFKTALKELPRTGRIGFQNHGQVAWFKNVRITILEAQ
ncbi:MAG: DUF1080 domain-containing protein [Rubripirellula sp.]|nr:DUF1080 domain-containing protein [Rubripirellula sp.]